MAWHFRLGYLVFSLLVFRLLWGFVGGHWSRWTQLPLAPAQVLAYLRGHSASAHGAGHNPLGAWSILALMCVLAFQVGTGLVSDDEIANAGPLSSVFSGSLVAWATSWHKGWGKSILIGLLVLHLAALTWYRWQKSAPLVPAMWHGDKLLETPATASDDRWKDRLKALLLFTMAVLVVAAVLYLTA